ncbi:MAG: carbamoyl-phosphate synthase large subunit, partial [candidate division Zixibacteria bacterium]|nr:carbamoyl-phosphate synthase large subunit [candidate division Zixibacteria bacterium]
YKDYLKKAPKDEALKKRIREHIAVPQDGRLFYLKYAMQAGMSIDEIYGLTFIDPWFLRQIEQIVQLERELVETGGNEKKQRSLLRQAKRFGFSDRQLAFLWGTKQEKIRDLCLEENVRVMYKLVDTCAAEFKAYTPYFYSTHEEETENEPSTRKKVIILGGGPNRIGQGIEFDYCCVHAAFALKELGYETIMVNSNPETVSTDYDTSDKLFFEPLTQEDVLSICSRENPLGVIVQLGGQTPLNLAKGLEANGVRILGTSADSIDRAEDRDRFQQLLEKINLRQPANGIARNLDDACRIAEKIGYPVVIRPSYVLGGRAMEIVYTQDFLKKYMKEATDVSEDMPILIDKYLEDATEVDVDLIGDGKTFVIGAVMEHIEEAGIHSGDSAMVLPPHTLKKEIVNEIIKKTKQLAKELHVVGLMNVQYAVKEGTVYCLEV